MKGKREKILAGDRDTPGSGIYAAGATRCTASCSLSKRNSPQSHREHRAKTMNQERDPLTEAVIGAAIEVHRLLGPGLLESVYERCLCYEPKLRGIERQRQVVLPVVYKGVPIDADLFMDVV